MAEKYGVRLKNPENVRVLLARTINELKAGTLSENKSRAIGYLCSILLKSMEVNELDARLQKIEQELKL